MLATLPKLYGKDHLFNQLPNEAVRAMAVREALALWNQGLHKFPESVDRRWKYGDNLFVAYLYIADLIRHNCEVSLESLESMFNNWSNQEVTYGFFARPVAPESSTLGVTLWKGEARVSSMDVAKYFEKEHKNVIRDVRELDCSLDFQKLNFEPMSRTVEVANSAQKEVPYYMMTRDGFTFLVMGYTGKRAAAFKEAYIKAFNAMEEIIRGHSDRVVEIEVDHEAERLELLRRNLALLEGMKKPESILTKGPEKLPESAPRKEDQLALPLPEKKQKQRRRRRCYRFVPPARGYYTATQLAEEFETSRGYIGKVALRYRLKAPKGERNEFGYWYADQKGKSESRLWAYSEFAREWMKKYFEAL